MCELVAMTSPGEAERRNTAATRKARDRIADDWLAWARRAEESQVD